MVEVIWSMANRDGIPLYTSFLILLLTHCYSVFAILDKKVLYVEDEPRRNYRVEDFLWTGSGDGEPDSSSRWKTTTVFRTTTTTILATAFISPTPVVVVQKTTVPCVDGFIGEDNECHTLRPTPTMDMPSATVLPPWPPPPQLSPDQRYWLITVLKANLSSDQLAAANRNFEPKLAHLYKTAFQRQQLRHLGLNGNNSNNGHREAMTSAIIKRRREERPLTVRMINVTSSTTTATLRLVYSVQLAGRPVAASAAATDMRLLSDKEVTAELGFPVITKAERQ